MSLVHFKFQSTINAHDTIKFDGPTIKLAALREEILQKSKLVQTPDFYLQMADAQTGEVYKNDTDLILKNATVVLSRRPIQKICRQSAYRSCKIFRLDDEHEAECSRYPAKPKTVRQGHGIPMGFLVPATADAPGAVWTKYGFAIRKVDAEAYMEATNRKKEQPHHSLPEFIIPSNFICPICEEIMKDAVKTSCCATQYCDECVRETLMEDDEQLCPECNEVEPPDELQPAIILRLAVAAFLNKTKSGFILVKPKKPVGVAALAPKPSAVSSTPTSLNPLATDSPSHNNNVNTPNRGITHSTGTAAAPSADAAPGTLPTSSSSTVSMASAITSSAQLPTGTLQVPAGTSQTQMALVHTTFSTAGYAVAPPVPYTDKAGGYPAATYRPAASPTVPYMSEVDYYKSKVRSLEKALKDALESPVHMQLPIWRPNSSPYHDGSPQRRSARYRYSSKSPTPFRDYHRRRPTTSDSRYRREDCYRSYYRHHDQYWRR